MTPDDHIVVVSAAQYKRLTAPDAPDEVPSGLRAFWLDMQDEIEGDPEYAEMHATAAREYAEARGWHLSLSERAARFRRALRRSAP